MFFRTATSAQTTAPDHCTEPLSLGAVPGACPASLSSSHVPTSRPRKRAAKPAPVFRLYPEPMRPAQMQAATFLKILRETIDVNGHWLLVQDLSRCYREIAQQEGWPELGWTAIGREMGKLTRRRTIKRHGKRHVAYLLK